MQIPIFVDTSSIVEDFNITAEQVDNMLDNLAKGLAAGYMRQLEIEAQNTLHQTKKRYIQNIRLIDSGRLEGIVLLDYSKDPLIKMIEEGATAFDMKEGFFNSSKVKYTKDGRKYLTIPFRVGAPGTIGESDVFSSIMPEEIYQVVKNKPLNKSNNTRSTGLTIGEMPEPYKLPQARKEISNSDGNVLWKEYMHKSSLYEGLTKQSDSVTGQNTYNSFRRVSEEGDLWWQQMGSDPNSWIHPGIEAHNLIQVALNNFNQEHELGMGINVELQKLGFNVTE